MDTHSLPASSKWKGRSIPVSPVLKAALGGLLLGAGLQRRGLAGLLLTALGGGLLLELAPQCSAAEATPEAMPAAEPSLPEEEEVVVFDIVQEASEESFPASDAPGWR